MSAILGLFGERARLDDVSVRRMMRHMQARGIERIATWRDSECILAVGRYGWEMEPDFSAGALVASDDRYVVAADASVYYRHELRAALEARGVPPTADSPAALILAAYRAWGDGWTDHVEGDYAVLVWDRVRGCGAAYRDFAGKRPLHYSRLGRDLVVASTIGGVRAHPRVPADLNTTVVAGTTAGLISSAGPETVYRAIEVLPNAHRMVWSTWGAEEPSRFWDPPFGQPARATSHEEAADELRELLTAAVRTRMSRSGPDTVWMSGGWDSTSVFAAAQNALRLEGAGGKILPVSISYPPGDPGREDELIQATADHWSTPVHWIDIAEVPFFDRDEERAVDRDEPYLHLYERWNRALAEGTRAWGSRLAFDGNGGDQLFANSDVFLADLLRRGRWLTLAREWPTRPRGGLRGFFSSAIQPNLGPVGLGAARMLRRGRPLRHYLERPLPPWLDMGFARDHGLAERDRGFLLRDRNISLAEREIDWQFTNLFISRAFSVLGRVALAAGVELRSPLSDRRIIELALRRPWWERSSGTETKILLRRSMRGLLPEAVLTPRLHRTGITAGYSHAWMRDVFPRLLGKALEKPLLLEEMGVVRGTVLKAEAERYAAHGGSAFMRVNLFYTLQTEYWLRARRSGAVARSEPTWSPSEARTLAVS